MMKYLNIFIVNAFKMALWAVFFIYQPLLAQTPFQIIWGMDEVLTGVSSHVNFTAEDAKLSGAHQFSLWPYLSDGNGGNAYVTTYWSNEILTERYMDFSIQAHEFEYTITSMSFRVRRSDTGPANLVVRSSLDGFTSNLHNYNLKSAGSFYTVTIPLGISELSSGISFRIYGYQAPSYLGTFYFDHIVINGHITTIVLPISLYFFKAKLQEQNVHLEWEAQSHENSSHFIVEKSTDLISFESIARVESKGESNTKSLYQWIDKNPISGVNYYRLKMYDRDGKYTYSHAIDVIYFSDEISYVIAPNPATGSIISVITDGGIIHAISLFHLSGKLIELNDPVYRGRYIDLFPKQALSSGIYVLSLKVKGKWIRKEFVVL